MDAELIGILANTIGRMIQRKHGLGRDAAEEAAGQLLGVWWDAGVQDAGKLFAKVWQELDRWAAEEVKEGHRVERLAAAQHPV